MRNVTEAFISALRGSHRMVSDVRILTSYQEGVQPEGTLLSTIRGSVTLSSTANIRGSATVLIGDVTWPQLNDDLLTPYGNEAFIRRGIDYGNGTIEWVSLGYFRLDDVSQSTNSKYPLQITCYDRMIGIIEARLLTPVQFFAGITVGEIVETLVWEVYPDATIEWDDDTHGIIVTRTQIAEQDRYGFLNDLITSYGKIMYFDYRGMLVIESVPSTTESVFDVNAGAHGVLISASRSRTREGVFNAVVVNGIGADTAEPVFAAVIDNESTSPTNYNGRFGKVPYFYTSTFITTTDQAFAAAGSLLSRTTGLPYSVDFDAIVNPALVPYDTIAVSEGTTRELHVLDTIDIPLDAESSMTANTRVRERTTL
jgi:hypothetical protein